MIRTLLTLSIWAFSVAVASAQIAGTGNFGPSRVFHVIDSTTQTTLTSDGNLVNPIDIELFGPNEYLVSSTNGGTATNTGALVRVNRTTGAQTVLSTNAISSGVGGATLFLEPRYFDFDLVGNVVVAEPGTGHLVRVDPITGFQTSISSAGLLTNPHSVVVEASGDMIVANFTAGSIVRVTPGGSQSALTSGTFINNPYDLALDAAGNIYVSDNADGQIIRVDPFSGSQTVIASGGNLFQPRGMDYSDGFLYVANRGATVDQILRIDPVTGAQFLLTSGTGLSDFTGVVAVPEPSAYALLALAGVCGLIFRFRRPKPVTG